MKVFLTGGSGFIGSWVLKTLLAQDHDVTILVRNLDKVPSLHKLPNVTIVQGQLLDWDTIDKAMVGQDACVHVALGWGDTPVEMLKNDTLATVFLLEQAEKHNLRHFLYTSSTAAIGEVQEFMKEDVQTRPVDLYGATKAASEAFILGYSEKAKGLHCNIIRPGYTFGNPAFADSSTQPDKRFFDIVMRARTNRDIELTEHDGTQFIWVGDLAKIYSGILQTQLHRRVFHGLASDFVSWERIAEQAIEMCNSRSKIMLQDKGWSDSPCLYDVSGIQKQFHLSFSPHVHITDHLRYLMGLPIPEEYDE